MREQPRKPHRRSRMSLRSIRATHCFTYSKAGTQGDKLMIGVCGPGSRLSPGHGKLCPFRSILPHHLPVFAGAVAAELAALDLHQGETVEIVAGVALVIAIG